MRTPKVFHTEDAALIEQGGGQIEVHETSDGAVLEQDGEFIRVKTQDISRLIGHLREVLVDHTACAGMGLVEDKPQGIFGYVNERPGEASGAPFRFGGKRETVGRSGTG